MASTRNIIKTSLGSDMRKGGRPGRKERKTLHEDKGPAQFQNIGLTMASR